MQLSFRLHTLSPVDVVGVSVVRLTVTERQSCDIQSDQCVDYVLDPFCEAIYFIIVIKKSACVLTSVETSIQELQSGEKKRPF